MTNIKVGRYSPKSKVIDGDIEKPLTDFWQGWLEPEDKSWIMFIDGKGRPTVFLDRDPLTGAIR